MWIPVTDRLPEDTEIVLVTCKAKNGNLSVNRAYYMNGCWHGQGSMAGVIAWMPLPDPYKESEDDIALEITAGRWIGQREHCENLGLMPSGIGVYEWCSNCDCAIDVREWQRINYNYCPNCGAKMEVN